MSKEKQAKLHADFRVDFTNKVKSWFYNKGIVNRLELFLKSQMIVEFQRNCGQPIEPQNTILSPKIQAIKVLIADFLLHEDLLFSLSVYCTEVPFLLNLTQYKQYISFLANSDQIRSQKTPKPKFSEEELWDLLEALQLNLKRDDFNLFYEVYKSNKMNSLLPCLLSMIPKLISKHRSTEHVLKKTRKKEKTYEKLLASEKNKLKNMYAVVQNAYAIIEKHKADMKEVIQNQNVVTNEMKLNDLEKKEAEIATWHKALELRERSIESKFHEVERKTKLLEEQERKIQSKYEMLQQEREKLKIDENMIRTDETDKLQEFEHKFCTLQEQVQQMLKAYNERQQKSSDEMKSSDKNTKDQQSEKEILSNMEEYVDLMEKENTLLKLSSTKQRKHIGQLAQEITFLKSRLNCLERELQIHKRIGSNLKTPQKDSEHNKRWYSEITLGSKSTMQSVNIHPSSRRKLFRDHETVQISKLTSSDTGTSKDTTSNLTDEIVADAKSKVKELENESEALNRNFKSLQNILTRNIALSESKILNSPCFSQLSRSYSDLDSPNMSPNRGKYALSSSFENATSSDANQEFKTSSPRASSIRSNNRKSSSFRDLLMRRQKERRKNENEGMKCSKTDSEFSSELSSPRDQIDRDAKIDAELLEADSPSIDRRDSSNEKEIDIGDLL